MTKKPTYHELEKRVRELEKAIFNSKKAQKALQESEEFLKNIFEAIQDGISVLDTDLNVIKTNRWMVEMYKPKTPLIGQKCYQVYQDRRSPCPRCPALQTIKTGEPHTEIVPYPSAKAPTGWIELSTFPIKDETGHVANVIESVKDITERKLAKEALRESEERFREMADHIHEVFWLFDWAAQRVIYVSPAYETIWGRSVESLYNRYEDWTDSIHPDDLQSAQESFEKILETGGGEPRKYRIVRPDGSIRWISDRGFPIRNGDGNVVRITGIAEDITDQRRIQQENLKRQQFLESVLYHAPDAIITLDPQHRVIDWNEGAFKMFGYTREEVMYAQLDDLVARGSHHDEASGKTQEVLSGHRVEAFETVRYRKDGTPLRVIAAGSPILMGGDLKGVVAFYTDITDRVRAEENLQKSEEKLRNIIEHSSNMFYSHTADHELTYISPQSREFLQCEPDEAMTRWTEFVTDNPINKKGFELTEKAIQTGKRQPPYELEIVGKKGQKILAEVRESPIVKNGNTVTIVGSLTDITERKLADQALKSSHKRFLTVLNSIDATIYVADMETHEVLFMNQNMVEVFGRDMTGEICWEVFRGEAGPCSGCTNDQLVDENGNPTDVCIWDGKNPVTGKWYINYDRAIEWIDGRLVRLQVATDITELKNMEKMLHQAHKMEAIGTLAGGIAHDFNNLLMGIQGRASLLSSELGLSHPQIEHSRAIEEYVKSAAALTKQLLGFARGGKYNVEPLNISELLVSTAEMFGRTHKELRIHKKLHPAPVVIEGDKQQIEQLLLNLFINAWQAMPEGGEIYLETTLVSLEGRECRSQNLEPGRYCKISVTDTGIGMDKFTLERIFDPFFTTKDKERGTGLGLASAYGIVKNHDGMIKVSSEIGHGARFDIFLPISGMKVRRTDPVDKGLIIGTETILLVDDEAMVLEVGKAMLENLGYQVIAVDSGEQALTIIQRNADQLDLVLLDMIMPDMDGGKTFDAIRDLNPKVPVILSSGYAMNSQASEIMRRGCNGFIQKPFNLSELSNTIRKILDAPLELALSSENHSSHTYH